MDADPQQDNQERQRRPLWGVPYPGEEGDFARVDMKASKLSSPVENFTISFDKSGSGCVMNLDWKRRELRSKFRIRSKVRTIPGAWARTSLSRYAVARCDGHSRLRRFRAHAARARCRSMDIFVVANGARELGNF